MSECLTLRVTQPKKTQASGYTQETEALGREVTTPGHVESRRQSREQQPAMLTPPGTLLPCSPVRLRDRWGHTPPGLTQDVLTLTLSDTLTHIGTYRFRNT